MYDTLSTLSVRRRRHRSSHGPHLHGFPLAPLGYHPRLSMGCPLWGQWVSTQLMSPSISILVHRVCPCGYSPLSYRSSPPAHCIWSCRNSYLLILSISILASRVWPCGYLSLISPISTLAPRVWSCGYSSLSASPTFTQSRLRRRRTMLNRG